MKRWMSLLAVSLALPACAPTSEDESTTVDQPFVFSSFIDTSVVVTVVDENGAPLQGVSVSVEDVYQSNLDDDSTQGHSVYMRGITDANGIYTSTARLPETISAVDIVVHDDAGRAGPWTDTALRDQLGFYGPSSRQTRSLDSVSLNLNVTLVEDV